MGAGHISQRRAGKGTLHVHAPPLPSRLPSPALRAACARAACTCTACTARLAAQDPQDQGPPTFRRLKLSRYSGEKYSRYLLGGNASSSLAPASTAAAYTGGARRLRTWPRQRQRQAQCAGCSGRLTKQSPRCQSKAGAQSALWSRSANPSLNPWGPGRAAMLRSWHHATGRGGGGSKASDPRVPPIPALTRLHCPGAGNRGLGVAAATQHQHRQPAGARAEPY